MAPRQPRFEQDLQAHPFYPFFTTDAETSETVSGGIRAPPSLDLANYDSFQKWPLVQTVGLGAAGYL
ncbi:MAG: hypothetical protein EBZ48_09965 [Proteobacteria bacterium]|nr:hypothetical protein [Pseudomonadota bacterium]